MPLAKVQTDQAPAAIGPYSQAIVANGFVFTAGQIPLDPAAMQMVEGDIAAQTEQVMKNLRAVLKEAGADLQTVVKTTVFLRDMNDFAADRKSTRLNSSHANISYAVFCLKK